MKTPDQAIYDHAVKIIEGKGYSQYPFNPGTGTPYPFVKMGGVQLIPRATKSFIIGEVHLTFDVWGTSASRRVVADIATDIFMAIASSTNAGGYQIMLDPGQSGIEIMTDNSTSNDLWRGRVSLLIKFF